MSAIPRHQVSDRRAAQPGSLGNKARAQAWRKDGTVGVPSCCAASRHASYPALLQSSETAALGRTQSCNGSGWVRVSHRVSAQNTLASLVQRGL
jgi:hypothetical protein